MSPVVPQLLLGESFSWAAGREIQAEPSTLPEVLGMTKVAEVTEQGIREERAAHRILEVCRGFPQATC